MIRLKTVFRTSTKARAFRPLLVGLLSSALLFVALGSTAQAQRHTDFAFAQPDEPIVGNDTCLECHSEPGLTMPLGNGELISLYVDQEVFDNSVHGAAGYACVQCHTNLGEYPHPTFTAEDRRDLSLQLYTACQHCHPSEYERTQDSVHDRARALGIREAAICTDCHGAHDTRRLTEPDTGELTADARPWIPQSCSRCHSIIYQKYLTSVHGAALFEQSNPDVPTCIECHGVHNIEDPTTSAFRLGSPKLCAGCHTDEQLMAKYDLSTAVLETYVADFHGTTVTLFEKQSPDAETNKPVCFDCHGVHEIPRTDDPERGLQVQANLLARCRVCHPGASVEFPDAWLSHYIPSPERHPLVYAVKTFYKFFIPGVLGGMAVLVALDASWRVRKRLKRPESIAPEQRLAGEQAGLPTPAADPPPTGGPQGLPAPPADTPPAGGPDELPAAPAADEEPDPPPDDSNSDA